MEGKQNEKHEKQIQLGHQEFFQIVESSKWKLHTEVKKAELGVKNVMIYLKPI